MRALVQKEIFEKSSNIPFLLKWFPMPETNHFLPWAFQKCHVVRKWFPFGNDFFGNHFHLEMIFFKWFTATKNDFWLFFAQKNDLQVRKIISFQFRNDFLHKKMISKQLKNDFLEMIFGTFSAGFEDVIYSWEKKHFLRKWAFPEMNGNHFFPENALQPPKYRFRLQKGVKMNKIRSRMIWDTFSVIFLEYRIKKYEHFLKVTFHGFAAHLKDYFSAR